RFVPIDPHPTGFPKAPALASTWRALAASGNGISRRNFADINTSTRYCDDESISHVRVRHPHAVHGKSGRFTARESGTLRSDAFDVGGESHGGSCDDVAAFTSRSRNAGRHILAGE